MQIDLSTIKPSKRIMPPRITIYGPEKIGKTTLTSQIEGSLLIDIEAGSGALNVARVMRDAETGMLTTYKSFSEVLTAVETQDHNYQALVIDSVDWLESLVFQHVATENGKATIADIGYGNGYVAAENIFRDILRRLDGIRNSRNMVIVLIAHSEVVKFDNPMSASYDQYRLKLHKRIAPLVNEWSDCLLFANLAVKVKDEQNGMSVVKKATDQGRVLYTGKSEAYVAGNRFNLPPILPLEWNAFIGAFAEATK